MPFSLSHITNNKVAQGGKGLFDQVWKATDKYLGEPSNKLAGKLGVEAFWPSSMDRECDKAARILRVFTLDGGVETLEQLPLNVDDKDAKKKTQKVIKKIPPEALNNAKGLAIFTVFRTGFGWSAASGSGVVLARLADGKWSGPSGILIHTVGFGLLVGADIYDVVLILRTESALESFTNPKFNLGAQLAIAAGPVGNGVVLDAGYQQAPCWSYTKSKGLYAGVQLDGTFILERSDENARFYGAHHKVAEIFSGKLHMPLDAEGLIQTIQAASGQETSKEKIPEGLPPSELDEKVPDEVKGATEGFGAPPKYDDLAETPTVKCTYCDKDLSINDLSQHDCRSPLELGMSSSAHKTLPTTSPTSIQAQMQGDSSKREPVPEVNDPEFSEVDLSKIDIDRIDPVAVAESPLAPVLDEVKVASLDKTAGDRPHEALR